MLVVFGSSKHHLIWTEKVLDKLKAKFDYNFLHVKNRKQMMMASDDLPENTLIIIVGWGWHIPDKIIKKHKVLGLHPSDLPKFAGGTPMQHQIISGVTSTKMSLFELEHVYDTGDIISKCDLSLSGNMTDIFTNLANASTEILVKLLSDYPEYPRNKQDISNDHKIFKRLQHKDGIMDKELYNKMTARQIYNFIRCREDPYPNTYYQDNTGTVLFKMVDFIPNSVGENNE
jgi:methionyl-tRNA formyltransferase